MMINCAGWTGSNLSLVVTDANSKSSTASTLALAACPTALSVSTPTITSQTYSTDYNTTTLALSSTIANGSGNKTYSWTTSASGGTLTWTNDTGTIPAGTSAPTLVLPSVDLKSGTQTVTIHVVDALGQTADVPVTIPAPPSAC
jgi:hypothetical protein